MGLMWTFRQCRQPNGMRLLSTASMQFGLWEFGSAALPALRSPTKTRTCSMIFGGRFLIYVRKTTWDRPLDPKDFYTKLLKATDRPAFREGSWSLCNRTGRPDNWCVRNLVSWTWVHQEERYLIVVNLSDLPAQSLVQVHWNMQDNRKWQLKDVLRAATYERHGSEMLSPGLYVELGPWDYPFFQCLRTNNV
jgi:hypothetical protein